jgi:hypothetical protein
VIGSIHSELAKTIMSDRWDAARRAAESARAVREARAAARGDQASSPPARCRPRHPGGDHGYQ